MGLHTFGRNLEITGEVHVTEGHPSSRTPAEFGLEGWPFTGQVWTA